MSFEAQPGAQRLNGPARPGSQEVVENGCTVWGCLQLSHKRAAVNEERMLQCQAGRKGFVFIQIEARHGRNQCILVETAGLLAVHPLVFETSLEAGGPSRAWILLQSLQYTGNGDCKQHLVKQPSTASDRLQLEILHSIHL